MEDSITFTELSINLPVKMKYIKDLSIKEKINEHAAADITCMIDETEGISPIYHLSMKNLIQVNYVLQGEEKILFAGYPVQLEIEVLSGIYEIRLQLAGASIFMDFQKKCRSFQNKNAAWNELIYNIVKQDYQGFCCLNKEKTTQNKVFIQYEETDWAFIKRVASQWNVPIISRAGGIKPSIFIGIPDGIKYAEEYHNYTVKSERETYLYEDLNLKKSLSSDCIFYEFDSQCNYELGDRILYNKTELVVFEKSACMEKSILRFCYKIKAETAIGQIKRMHCALQGKSFMGKVIARKQDLLKIQFIMDKEQKISEASWFPFSTSYAAEKNTGIYQMPEIGSLVSLYLPDQEENHAYVRYVNRIDGSWNPRSKNADQKCFGIPDQVEMWITPEELTLSTSNNTAVLNLNPSKSMDLAAYKGIRITSSEIEISGRKVTLSAKQQLEIGTENSNILVDNKLHMKGDNGVNIG